MPMLPLKYIPNPSGVVPAPPESLQIFLQTICANIGNMTSQDNAVASAYGHVNTTASFDIKTSPPEAPATDSLTLCINGIPNHTIFQRGSPPGLVCAKYTNISPRRVARYLAELRRRPRIIARGFCERLRVRELELHMGRLSENYELVENPAYWGHEESRRDEEEKWKRAEGGCGEDVGEFEMGAMRLSDD